MSQKTVLAFTMPAGRHEISVTSLTLVNNTAKTVDTTVPAGKRWILLNIKCTNPDDVNRAVTVAHYKEAAKTNLVKTYAYQGNVAALTGVIFYPINVTASYTITFQPYGRPDILDEGETITCIWAAGGASAGGTDADGLVIEYLELDI